jgi:hypothetical protein
MSGSVLDGIAMEQRNVPAAVIGAEKLVVTTGRGMARAQGYPNLEIASINQPLGIMTSTDAATVAELVAEAVPQVERILLGNEASGGESK